MEIKAELILPYTEKERLNFVVSQNHRFGYEIRQVEGTWQEEIQVPCMKTVTEIIQEPIFDDEGNPVLDEEGNPTYKDVTVTREIQETETIVEIVKQPKCDEDGNPVLDENGEQVLEDVEVEKEIPKYRTEIVTHTGYNLQAWGYTEEDYIIQRKETFTSQFLVTSLGNFRLQPKGYANAQQAMDVINTMATALGGLTEQLTNLVIFYPTPDFTKAEQCTEEWLVANQIKPNVMTLADWQKFYLEFCQLYAMQQYKSEVVNENTTDTTTDISNEVGE
nr:MAG TPA: hypothetical protein [Caudoviricetes sp.]